MTALAVMGLLPANLPAPSGRVIFEGRDLLALPERERRDLAGRRIAMIFQEPSAALNPIYRVGDQVAETFRLHTKLSAAEIRERVLALFREVRLPDPELLYHSYPHQLSGGQCQRVMIATALALDPAILIADEPTTALDVTTQAQILRLMLDLRQRHGTGILFITHDFGVVAEIADRGRGDAERPAGRGRAARPRAAPAGGGLHPRPAGRGAEAGAAARPAGAGPGRGLGQGHRQDLPQIRAVRRRPQRQGGGRGRCRDPPRRDAGAGRRDPAPANPLWRNASSG